MADADVERARWIALRRAGLGSESFRYLIRHFGGIAEAWDAPDGEAKRAGLRTQYVRAFERARRTFDPEGEMAALAEHEVRTYIWEDEAYPDLLKEIPSSPPVLFVRGSAEPRFRQALAVVGTRDATPYGRDVCEQLCMAAARAGVAIVSGLARGIDSIAHRAALDVGAPTAAVLGGGIDAIHPRENAGLAERIAENGCLVSEYPVGVKARPQHFPLRNRIISGLAQATLVVEAGTSSGALITARIAVEEQNREVLAVPWDMFAKGGQGVNRLIRRGEAKLVGSVDDLLEELNVLSVGQPPLPEVASVMAAPAADADESASAGPAAAPATEAVAAAVVTETPAPVAPAPAPPAVEGNEGRVLSCLDGGPLHVDEVARMAELPIQVVTGALLTLELRGLVRQQAPMVYRRAT